MTNDTTVDVGKLKPEVKAKWLAALRSGEYQQGVSQLRYEDPDKVQRFCCLGVLCDLAVKQGVIEAPELRPGVGSVYVYDGATTLPSSAVTAWAYEVSPGNHDEWMVIEERKGVDGDEYPVFSGLTELNDEQNRTFVEIADVIEESL